MSTTISRTTGQAPPVTVIDLPGISPATIPLPELSPHQAIEAYVTARSSGAPAKRGEPRPVVARRALESCSDPERSLVANIELHPFIQAVQLAFAEHRPLVLSPDAIWLLVTQGFAAHVNANSQALRSQFVSHAGKIRLTVRRDDFVKGSSKNAWNEAIAEFIVHFRDHVKSETMDLLQPRFSTTTPTDVVASHIVLMDAFQSYFDYEVLTLCGIPQILLEGTVEDWEDLAMRARGLAQFDLAWWMKYLVPILDEFASAAKGTIREPFWRSIYKIDEMSGGPYVTGWINGFFPYLLDRTSGQATERHPQMSGPVAAKAPVSISIRSVPASIPPAQARKPMSWIDRLIRWP